MTEDTQDALLAYTCYTGYDHRDYSIGIALFTGFTRQVSKLEVILIIICK